MKGFASKVIHTLKTEGLGSVISRTARFLLYKRKRMMVDKSETIAQWKALKGKYQGQRAFLLGNGPSLNATELYLLKDEFTMCFNRWDLMLERLPWLPSFFTVIDDRVLLDTVEEANAVARLSDYAFFPDIHPYNIDFRDRIDKRDNVLWLYLDMATFSDNLPYCGINKTVANVGLQILGYLGFTEIYLLGVDMTYTVPKSAVIEGSRDITATEDDDDSHFDPRYFGKGRKFHVPMLDETFVKFREARAFFEARGVTIKNATVGGALEEFERITVDEVLGFDDHEKRTRFFALVQEKLRPGALDVEAALQGTLQAPGAEIDESASSFVIAADDVGTFIKKHVFNFIPFGPYQDRYLFVNRELAAASEPAMPAAR